MTAKSSAVIYGCAGFELNPDERDFFADVNPAGFILFGRNCQSPPQLRALVEDLCTSVDRESIPILIDQEGGRVVRLKPPHWRHPPAAVKFAELATVDIEKAKKAARLNAMLIGRELIECGVTVDCLPVLDVPQKNADPVIGDRALGEEPVQIADLGRSVCEGLLSAGVLPVIKHVPGHGRAEVDSHKSLPVVAASHQELSNIDFAPFAALADMPMAMTAHVVYTAIDNEEPATSSKIVVENIIRGEIGFDGVLMSDDICMKALSGGFGERAEKSIRAGCDLVLHCSGDMTEMEEVALAVSELSAQSELRLQRAISRLHEQEEFDLDEVQADLGELLGE